VNAMLERDVLSWHSKLHPGKRVIWYNTIMHIFTDATPGRKRTNYYIIWWKTEPIY